MHARITITDPDRKLDITLALEFTYRGAARPRFGWRDGGEPGESPAVEVDQARCLEIVVWCGKQGISAVPGHCEEDCLESKLGKWCLSQYADEIDRALFEYVHSRREHMRSRTRDGVPRGIHN